MCEIYQKVHIFLTEDLLRSFLYICLHLAVELSCSRLLSGCFPGILEIKAGFQLPHGVIRSELSPCHRIPFSELFPLFWKMVIELFEVFQALERTAPTGNSAEIVVKPIPVKATVVAVLQTVRFGHAPFH